MPPKNKGSGKKPPKARTPTLMDGLTKEELTKEQMEEHIARLREELDREREERNYFQVERDRIYTFWENTRGELQEVKAEIKNLDKDIEEDEARHQVEIKVYKQKMKHLLCEHQSTISELNADSLASAQVQQKEHEKRETELLTKMKSVKVDMEEINYESQVKELEVKHKEAMTEMRDRLEKQLKEAEAQYEAKVVSLRQELETMRTNELCETEDYWNNHIHALQSEHDKDLKDVSEVVKDIERILDGNESLKVQIKEMKIKQKQKEKDLVPVLQDKKHLTELLQKAEEEIAAKEKKMKCSTKEKDTKEKIVTRKLNNLKKEHETLTEKLDKLMQERDELYKTNAETIQAVQQKADLKNAELEDKLKVLKDRLERTDTQLNSVLSAPNVDQTALADIMNKTERELNSVNDTIQTLESKIDQVAKAREDLLLSYKAKLRVLGVPEEDLLTGLFESSYADKGPEQVLDLGFDPL